MHIEIDKSAPVAAIEPALGCVSARKMALDSPIPTAGFRFLCKDGVDSIDFAAYDLEKGYRTICPAIVFEGGSAVLEAARLNQMIRLMPEGRIEIEIDDKGLVKVTGGSSVFGMSSLPGEDFPDMPDLRGEEGYVVKQAQLKEIIGQTIFASAVNEPRQALNGIFFKAVEGEFTAVSCDGNRLALRIDGGEKAAKFDEGGRKSIFSFIIPIKAVTELARILSSDEEKTVRVIQGAKNVVYELGDDSIFFSRLIDTEYIDYIRFIPTSFKTEVTVDAKRFMNALERASLITEERTAGQVRSAVKCRFADDIAEIGAVSSTGRVRDEFRVEMEGDPIEIAFNCRFLLDAVRASDSEKLRLSLISPIQSMIIEDPETEADEKYLFLVLPVKMRS